MSDDTFETSGETALKNFTGELGATWAKEAGWSGVAAIKSNRLYAPQMPLACTRLSVHPEARPDCTGWVAIFEVAGVGGYRIPAGSEEACWRGVWAFEQAGFVIPDDVLDEATGAA